MKTLWIDTETTGTDSRKHDIVEVAGLIEIDGVIVEEFDYFCRPYDPKEFDPEGLKKCGVTIAELKQRPDPKLLHVALNRLFERFISKYDRTSKFLVAGHNPKFDLRMLEAFFKKSGDIYLFSWMSRQPIDTWQMALQCKYLGLLKELEDLKLGTLAKHFGIELEAHKALNDIRATRKVGLHLLQLIQTTKPVIT